MIETLVLSAFEYIIFHTTDCRIIGVLDMSHDEIDPFIDDYIEKARSVLPEGFKTDDFLEDLRSRIIDSLDAKMKEKPTENLKVLLFEVFEEMGPPEKIKEQSNEQEISPSSAEGKTRTPELTLAIRGIVSGAVVVIAATIMYYTAGWDFSASLVLFSVLAIVEWFYHVWEMRKHS